MQHGVKALDGGDADAADAVEQGDLQLLDDVGEFFRAAHEPRKLTEF